MLKKRTMLSPQKLLLITPCIVIPLLFFKLIHVPPSAKSTESPVSLKLFQLKKHDLVSKLRRDETVEMPPGIPENPSTLVPSCPNVLTNMVQGYWKQHAMTPGQQKEIKGLLDFLVRYGVPQNFQREDLRCGNVTYPLFNNKWLRAVCDEHGATPCCYHNKCVSKTTEECKCDNCFDLRTRIIAEYADWIPLNRKCTVKVYNKSDACELLSDHVIVVIGDSMARHVYITLLLLLQNNYIDGALKPNTPKEIRKECLKMEILTDKKCRHYVAIDITVCGGRVKLSMKEYKSVRNWNQTAQVIKHVSKSSKSLVLLGLGVHDKFNSTAVIESYLKPLKQLYSSFQHSRTKLLWASPSSFGLLKANLYPQRKVDVLRFMKETGKYLNSANIPQFNTYDLTHGVRSQDGHHYGFGINKWKVFILLNYIQELKTKGQW